MKNAFDEIARKNADDIYIDLYAFIVNLPFDAANELLDRVREYGARCASRLAQAAVEATITHIAKWHTDNSEPCENPDCQSDILRRTEEKLK